MPIQYNTNMNITLLLLLAAFSLHSGAEEFNLETPFKTPVQVPAIILRHMVSELTAAERDACMAVAQSALFEAQTVHLNSVAKAYLLKPAHRCLCVQQSCPVWLYSATGKTSRRLWHVAATEHVDLLDKKLSGYRELKEYSNHASHGHESIWSWNKHHYEEIYRNDWVWNEQLQCRLGKETTQLMDGHMEQQTKQCIQKEVTAE